MPTTVLHYAEEESRLARSGIGTSIRHQRKALQKYTDITVIETPAEAGLTPSRVADGYVPPSLDVLHMNVVGPRSLALARQYQHTDLPVVFHTHVTAEDFGESFRFSSHLQPVVQRYVEQLYNYADRLICPSNYTKTTLGSYDIAPPISVVTNGVDTASLDGYESLRQTYREQYDLDGPVVFTIGNVFERKGLSTFVRVAERMPSYEFVWFGPYDTGPQASSTVRRYTENPPDNVTFTGWVEDKRGAFAAGDIYFFPTKEENQGIAALEAMTCSKPAVLSNIPVFQELYDDGVDCIMARDAEGYEQAIRRVNTTPALADRLGRNGNITARQHSLPRVADGLEEVYQRLL